MARKATPITKALKEKYRTNLAFYADEHNLNKRSLEDVVQGRRFIKKIVLQLINDGLHREVIETFKEDKEVS